MATEPIELAKFSHTSLIIIDKGKGSLVSVLFQIDRDVRDRNQTRKLPGGTSNALTLGNPQK
ncbi:hypothetical protein DPMN_109003 [Dreissena polymorpha]|uniref:Uncharacterized protein n=1 Tax=Dreissena polymorpha TaxID=45954 RepID=A0A9D4K9V9_DREPO|nr:hypothetical protein DPMN_109003 [Dreissena polymorpha]